MLLTLGCINLTIILLANAADHRRDVAIQVALGADQRHLRMQSLREGVLLTAGGRGLWHSSYASHGQGRWTFIASRLQRSCWIGSQHSNSGVRMRDLGSVRFDLLRNSKAASCPQGGRVRNASSRVLQSLRRLEIPRVLACPDDG